MVNLPVVDDKIPTKRKILSYTLDLFATKGYTETSVRDIATAVGVKSASLYNHFTSKEDILKFMLDDFDARTKNIYNNTDMQEILQKNPTVFGVMSCLQVIFSVLSDEYYYKVLHVLYQEQHRNTIVRNSIAKVILETEDYIEKIFDVLVNLNVMRQDAKPDFWKKVTTSLFYAFQNRMMLGFGDDSSDYTGLKLKELLYCLFEMAFKMYSVTGNKAD